MESSPEDMNVTRKDQALSLAESGFKIFPLRPGMKEPYLGEYWSDIMTTDSETINAWFQQRKDMNYGVCPGDRHVVIDLDVKPDANGVNDFFSLELEYGEVNTFSVETPSGGRHLYLRVTHAVSNANQFPKGIDVRGAGGYVVGPGSRLVEGLCKAKDTPGEYAVYNDAPVGEAPSWIVGRLGKHEGERADRRVLFELDSEESKKRALAMLSGRRPAVEGEGGDEHTLVTCMKCMDYGLSPHGTMEVLTESFLLDGETEALSWNDRCDPPWDVYGDRGTLEEKVLNAWRYRREDLGSKGGGTAEQQYGDLGSDWDSEGYEDPDEALTKLEEQEKKDSEGYLFTSLDDLFTRNKRREYHVPGWMLSHGFVAFLAKRGTGKTVSMLDIALRASCDMDWHGIDVRSDLYVLYICGEDDAGAAEQIRAWQIEQEKTPAVGRFIFSTRIPNLMDQDDVKQFGISVKRLLPADAKCILFLDTWQRATATGSQNKDEDMQPAVRRLEELAEFLGGPAVAAFHPPKHDGNMVMGSSVIENSTSAIWTMTEQHGVKRLEVSRIKGKGHGNYMAFKFKEVALGEVDDFGQPVTGVVPIKIAGSAAGSQDAADEDQVARDDLAKVLRMTERHRADWDPHSSGPRTVSAASKFLCEEVGELAKTGDEHAQSIVEILNTNGRINLGSWRRMMDKIQELFADDYDFEDGMTLRLQKDNRFTRIVMVKNPLIGD